MIFKFTFNLKINYIKIPFLSIEIKYLIDNKQRVFKVI